MHARDPLAPAAADTTPPARCGTAPSDCDARSPDHRGDPVTTGTGSPSDRSRHPGGSRRTPAAPSPSAPASTPHTSSPRPRLAGHRVRRDPTAAAPTPRVRRLVPQRHPPAEVTSLHSGRLIPRRRRSPTRSGTTAAGPSHTTAASRPTGPTACSSCQERRHRDDGLARRRRPAEPAPTDHDRRLDRTHPSARPTRQIPHLAPIPSTMAAERSHYTGTLDARNATTNGRR